MPLLIVFLALLFPTPIQAEDLQVRIDVAPGLSQVLPANQPVQALVLSAFTRRFGQLVDARDAHAAVSLDRSGNVISITTRMVRGASSKSLRSTVPSTGLGSIVPTVVGDLAYLWLALGAFSAVPLSPPPPLLALLHTDTLTGLTGWQPEELEPIGLTGAGDGIMLCFPHRWLTLGPFFRLTPSTMRDILAQSAAPEPLQLSGIVSGTRGELYLLSERESRIAIIDPRLGTRQVISARQLTGLGGSSLPQGGLGILDNDEDGAGIVLYRPSAAGRVQVPARYASAMSTDSEGNFWIWDAAERRVRVISPEGREVSAVKPLFDGSIMQLPQQLVVQRDGSFLLGGSGEVWKFDSRGIPVWRLRQTGGKPAESLPASFVLAPMGDGSFALLDMQSRRLLQFGDAGQQVDLNEAQADLLQEKSLLLGSLADSFLQDFMYDAAEKAFRKAVDSARALLVHSPGDPDVDAELRIDERRLKEVRDSLIHGSGLELSSEGVPLLRSTVSFHDTLSVTLRLRNTGNVPMSGVLASFMLPGVTGVPARAQVGSLPPGASRQMAITFDVAHPEALDAGVASSVPVRTFMTWRQGTTEMNANLAAVLPFPAPEGPPARELAGRLAYSATSADPLLLDVAQRLRAENGGDPLAGLAAFLDWSGELRLRAAATGRGEAVEPLLPGGFVEARSVLRELSTSPGEWVVLTVSIAMSLGLPAGVMTWNDSALALVESDMPLSEALDSMPFLSDFSANLRKLSRHGHLCLPFSGRLRAAPSAVTDATSIAGPAARAFASGLRECQQRGTGSAVILWTDPAFQAQRSPPLAAPMQLELPSVPSPASRDTLRLEIQHALGEAPK